MDDGAADLVFFFSFVQPLTGRAPPMEGKKRRGEKRPGAAYVSAHPSMLSLRCVRTAPIWPSSASHSSRRATCSSRALPRRGSMCAHLISPSATPKANPILVEEVTLNPEAAAKKHKVAADKAAASKSRAPSPGKRPAKKAGGKSGKKINSSATAGDDVGASRSLPARVTRLTPQVSLIQRALKCLTYFSQHLIAGMQVLAIVKEVQDLELRVRFDANSLLLCILTRLQSR